jgi:hypothetical protein
MVVNAFLSACLSQLRDDFRIATAVPHRPATADCDSPNCLVEFSRAQRLPLEIAVLRGTVAIPCEKLWGNRVRCSAAHAFGIRYIEFTLSVLRVRFTMVNGIAGGLDL